MAQTVSELMSSAPVTLSSGQTVADAARAMREAGIGDVLIRNNRRDLGSDYGFSPTRADQGET